MAEEAQELVRAADSGGEFPARVAEAYARLGDGDVPGRGALERDGRGLRGGELRRPAGDVPARARRRRRSSSASATAGARSSPSARCSTEREGSLADLGMAVVVQRMVAARRLGRMFTIDPTKGRRDRMVVEAVFGLGEGVVSGQLTPDHYVLARDGRVKRTRLHTQPYAIVHDPAGGVREEELPPSAGEAQTLTEEQLARLAKVGDRPRGAPRRPAGHRVGDAGRRALRPPVASGDDMSVRRRPSGSSTRRPRRRSRSTTSIPTPTSTARSVQRTTRSAP